MTNPNSSIPLNLKGPSLPRLLRPGGWLNMKRLWSDADREANDLVGNHTPKAVIINGTQHMVPADLINAEGEFLVTKSGAPTAGRMLDEDMQQGSESVAVTAFACLLPLFFAVVNLVSGSLVDPSTNFLLLLLLCVVPVWILKRSEMGGTAAVWITIFLAAFLPAYGLAGVDMLGGLFESKPGADGPPVVVLVFFGAIVLVMGVAFLLLWMFDAYRRSTSDDTDDEAPQLSKQFVGAVAKVIGTLIGVGILSAACPGLLPLALYIPGVVYPLFHENKRIEARAIDLRNAAVANLGATNANTRYLEARKKQALNTINDKSPIIRVGVAEGMFVGKGDHFAYEAGQEVVMSGNDYLTHKVVFGRTGGGKTDSSIKGEAKQFLKEGVSVVLLDGKAQLGYDCSGIHDNYLIVDEHIEGGIAPLEGLRDEQIVQFFQEYANGASGSKDGSDKSDYFRDGGKEIIQHGVYLWSAANRIEKAKLWSEHRLDNGDSSVRPSRVNVDAPEVKAWLTTVEDKRKHRRSYLGLAQLTQSLQWFDGPEVQKLMQLVREHPDAKRKGPSMLKSAIRFIEVELPARVKKGANDSTGLAGLFSTVNNFMKPLMSNQVMLDWANLETGADVTGMLDRGGSIGVCLSHEQFGDAAVALTKLIKQRIYTSVMSRGKQAGKAIADFPQIEIFMDECQSMIGKEEINVIDKARQYKMGFVFATQSIEALWEKLGHDATSTLLENCRAFTIMNSSPATIEYYRNVVGAIPRMVTMIPNAVSPDPIATARLMTRLPEYDPSHPNFHIYQRMLASGLLHGRKEGHDVNVKRAAGKLRPVPKVQRVQVMVNAGEQPNYLFDASAQYALLEQGYALVQTMRGRHIRRDIVRLYYDATPAAVKAAKPSNVSPDSPDDVDAQEQAVVNAPTLVYSRDAYQPVVEADPVRGYELQHGAEIAEALAARNEEEALAPEQVDLLAEYAKAHAQRVHATLVEIACEKLRAGMSNLSVMEDMSDLDNETIVRVMNDATVLAAQSTAYVEPGIPTLYADAA